LFGNFFLDKVKNISGDNIEKIKLDKPLEPLTISKEEVQQAAKLLARKKSYCPDLVPQNLFKDSVEIFISYYIPKCRTTLPHMECLMI